MDQNKELIGNNGLLPVKLFLSRVKRGEEIWINFLTAPTLLWFFEPWDDVDWLLDGIAWIGITISAVILITGM